MFYHSTVSCYNALELTCMLLLYSQHSALILHTPIFILIIHPLPFLHPPLSTLSVLTIHTLPFLHSSRGIQCLLCPHLSIIHHFLFLRPLSTLRFLHSPSTLFPFCTHHSCFPISTFTIHSLPILYLPSIIIMNPFSAFTFQHLTILHSHCTHVVNCTSSPFCTRHPSLLSMLAIHPLTFLHSLSTLCPFYMPLILNSKYRYICLHFQILH